MIGSSTTLEDKRDSLSTLDSSSKTNTMNSINLLSAPGNSKLSQNAINKRMGFFNNKSQSDGSLAYGGNNRILEAEDEQNE